MSASETSIGNQAQAASGRDVVRSFTSRFATPLTTGLFVVSAVSGVALFFRWASPAFHSMHEWLSLVLLVPFVLHVSKNWKSLVGYGRRGTLLVPLLAAFVVALPFAWSGLTGPVRGPAQRLVPVMTQARLSDLAPVLRTTPDALLAALRQRGFDARSADETLATVAATSGRPATEALFAVTPAP
jgi:hypothetical protein